MPVKNDHIHKYIRTEIGGVKIVRVHGKRVIDRNGPKTEIFKCALPGCTHYILNRNLAIGRKTICWRCGEELVLNMENTTLKRPTHTWCRGRKDSAA